jgi:tRNA-specific 2-thiouridylase
MKKKRIVVAMSGGVDSSTVAGLMKEAGHEVIGITLQLYDYGEALKKKGACCAGQDIADAREVAEKLEIPHYILNYESLFKESVMDEFAESYMNGETPIPCVRCNQSVKFKDLLKVAKDLEADRLVTGHYVKKIITKKGNQLHMGRDENKDQSYFLFTTTKEQLDFVDFPLGDMSKLETRKLAEKFGLPVYDKPDSQDICFVPNGKYAEVVAKLRPESLSTGVIKHIDGTVLGSHNGIINYTIGQRRGLGISNENPLYVVKIDPIKKIVFVGEEKYLYKTSFFINDINWLSDDEIPKDGIELKVKLRSGHQGALAKLYPANDLGVAKVELISAERAVTPGQACVFYQGTRLLGGGWIMRNNQNNNDEA